MTLNLLKISVVFGVFSSLFISALHAQESHENQAKSLALASTAQQANTTELAITLRKQLGDTVSITNLDSASCAEQNLDAKILCLSALANAQSAEWLLLVQADNPDFSTLSLLDVHTQKELGHARSDDNRVQSQTLAAVQALAAAGAKGDLILDGVQVFDRLRIDGHELPLDAGRTTVTLGIGQHSVELVRVGASTLRQIVFVPYAQALHIDSRAGLSDADKAAAQQKQTSQPRQNIDRVNIALLGGGAAAMILGLGIGLHMALVSMPQLNWLSAQQSSGLGCTDVSKTCWDAQVDAARSLTVLEGVLSVGMGLGGLAALGAGAWMLNEQSETTN